MENDGEAGETLDALLQNIEAQGRRNENSILVARALCRSELVCTMGCADGDSERVAACPCYEFLYLFRTCVAGLTGFYYYLILYSLESSELSLDYYSMSVSVVYYLLCDRDVFLDMSIITDVNPPSMQLLQSSKESPWSRCRQIGISGFSMIAASTSFTR